MFKYARRFDAVFLMLDPGATSQAMVLQSQLAAVQPRILFTPPEWEDPGAATPGQVVDFAKGKVLPQCGA